MPRARALTSLAASVVLGMTLLGGPAAAPAHSAAGSVHVPGVARYAGTIPAATDQVIVVKAKSWSTSHATLTAYQRNAAGRWVRAMGPVKARIGWSGLVVGTKRKQGTGKTPAGMYAITEAFGRKSNPGTRLPYRRIDGSHWWVQDNRSRYYNTMRRAGQGGFARTEKGANGSERLYRYDPEYNFSAVIDFNRPKPVRKRGSGIFLHVNGPGATAGCVSVTQSQMRSLLRWMRPGLKPRIILGEDDWLARR